MLKVIDDAAYEDWKRSSGVDTWSIVYEASTCYYGRSMRTRPGALIVTPIEIVHWSYDFGVTQYGIFEPSKKVKIPLSDVACVLEVRLWLIERLLFGLPTGCFRVLMGDSESHTFILYDDPVRLLKALASLGVPGVEQLEGQ